MVYFIYNNIRDMKGIIYKWTCSISNKSYIGQTTNEKQRELVFLNESKSYAGEKIDNARRKYGLDNGVWKKEVLKRLWCKDGMEDSLRQRLNYWERYFIEYYDTVNNGYNITNGGDCNFSKNVIDEMGKKSINNWNKLSIDKKNKIIKCGKEWYDSLSEEEKENHRSINLGKQMGHYLSRSLADSEKKSGVPKSEEMKQKLRNINTGKFPTSRKIVYQYSADKSELISTYRSIKEAATSININYHHFSEVIKKNNGMYRGFYWVTSECIKESCNPTGCCWIERIKRWRSKIRFNGKTYILGHFKNVDAASDIYQIANNKRREGIFKSWYDNINEHKLKIYEKYNEEFR